MNSTAATVPKMARAAFLSIAETLAMAISAQKHMVEFLTSTLRTLRSIQDQPAGLAAL
jgi:hypothetical protein